MTDLISTLADELLALINSKPSTPSKAEVEAFLYRATKERSEAATRVSRYRNLLLPAICGWEAETGRRLSVHEGYEHLRISSYPAGRAVLTRMTLPELDAAEAGGWQPLLDKHLSMHRDPEPYTVTKEALEKAVNAPECLKCGDHHQPDEICMNPLGTKRDEIFRKAFANTSKALLDAMNTSVYGGPTTEDREKYWANKLNEPFDKADASCPLSTNGVHAWSDFGTSNSDINVLHHSYHPQMVCACGARRS